MSDPKSAERQRRFRARQKQKILEAQAAPPAPQAVTPVIQAVTAAPSNDRLRDRLTDLEAENRALHDRLLAAEAAILRLRARS